MTAPLVRATPVYWRFTDDASLDNLCETMARDGLRLIGVMDRLVAVFVRCTAVRGADRHYYVEARQFTVDLIRWATRDDALVSWWYDDEETVRTCPVAVDGCGTDVVYDSACGEPEPPSYVLDAICARVRDAYPEHLHEWTY